MTASWDYEGAREPVPGSVGRQGGLGVGPVTQHGGRWSDGVGGVLHSSIGSLI